MWPVKKKKVPDKAVKDDSQSTLGNAPGDKLWASHRRLKTQVEAIELALSVTRRDVARIDRKQYREIEKTPATEEAEPLSPALFG